MDKNTLIIRYMDENAPVILLVLDEQGTILETNRYARKLFGEKLEGRAFHEVLVDFQNIFSLARGLENPENAQLLNMKTLNGSTETFYVFLQQLNEQIIVFGHQEIDEMETLSNELFGLNQELNNLTRQLSLKNRELKKANEKILELSRTDSLTGCANKGFFNERISEMISLAKRKSLPLSVVMSDLDYFKKINDRFGHDAGDLVLKGYADLLRQYTRTEDLVARFGGEEFVVLLPLTDIKQAFTMSERIRQALAKQDFLGNGYVVTVSCGVSGLKDEDRPEDLIKRADTAMYQAKDLGRNQSVTMEQ